MGEANKTPGDKKKIKKEGRKNHVHYEAGKRNAR